MSQTDFWGGLRTVSLLCQKCAVKQRKRRVGIHGFNPSPFCNTVSSYNMWVASQYKNIRVILQYSSNEKNKRKDKEWYDVVVQEKVPPSLHARVTCVTWPTSWLPAKLTSGVLFWLFSRGPTKMVAEILWDCYQIWSIYTRQVADTKHIFRILSIF